MKVTAIIPSLYEVDGEYLKGCVASLRATVDWDIIVVTNGGTYQPFFGPDGEDIPGITNHLHTRDQGQCNAVNIGASAAAPNTDYIFIINSDMYFAPGWLNYIEGEEWPLVWSPNLVEPTDNAGSAPPFLKLDAGYTLDAFQRDKVDEFVRAHEDNDEETGFNFPVFIRKDVWDTIGGYDVAYDPFGSNGDTDLQTKINIAGITPMRLRDVLVYHFSNKSGTFDFNQPDRKAFYDNNTEYFRDKFGFDRDELGSDVWYNKDMLPKDSVQSKFHPDWEGKYGEA